MLPRIGLVPSYTVMIVSGAALGTAVSCLTIGIRESWAWRKSLTAYAVLLGAAIAGAKVYGAVEMGTGVGGATFGGLRYPGGVLGAILAVPIIGRVIGSKSPVGVVSDGVALGSALAMAIARVGCFLHGCCYGLPTDLPWGVRFPRYSPAWQDHVLHGLIPPDAPLSATVHPLQLYLGGWSLVVFGILAYLYRSGRARGVLLLYFILLHEGARCLLEEFRGPAPMHLAQQLAFCAAMTSAAILGCRRLLRPQLVAATLIAAMTGIPPRIASGTTIDVPGDTASINEAIGRARSGDVVTIHGGAYSENLRFSMTSGIQVEAVEGETVTVKASRRSAGISITNSGEVVVRGLTIEGNGIFIQNAHDITLDGIVVTAAIRDGIRVDEAVNVRIVDGAVREARRTGIRVNSSPRFVVLRTAVKQSGRDGVSLYSCPDAGLENIAASENGRNGLRVGYSPRCSVKSSQILANERDGALFAGSRAFMLEGNQVMHNIRVGIRFRHSGNITVTELIASGNEVTNNGREDIVVER
jgi:phosphatidylglycerol:prolipoprotein diacylglycerol transferase